MISMINNTQFRIKCAGFLYKDLPKFRRMIFIEIYNKANILPGNCLTNPLNSRESR